MAEEIEGKEEEEVSFVLDVEGKIDEACVKEVLSAKMAVEIEWVARVQCWSGRPTEEQGER